MQFKRLGYLVAISFYVLSYNNALAKDLSKADIAMANRLSFGINSSLLNDISQIGSEKWLQQQLHPTNDDILPADISAMIDAMPHLKKSPAQQINEVADIRKKADAATQMYKSMPISSTSPTTPAPPASTKLVNDYRNETVYETRERRLLREIYNKNQLKEQMSWFWYNHFNIVFDKSDIPFRLAQYEDNTIRKHSLGKFRDLLEATLKDPAMLRYLDNSQNAVGHINENYAREIMELHTMGVGSGYTQADVEALAHILTGVGILEPNQKVNVPPNKQNLVVKDGDFLFNPQRHDFSDKVFLGHVIKGQGFAEVEQALDLISKNPATAHYVSLKLAKYFVSDNPPNTLVDAMAKKFINTDGDIAKVLDFMFHSAEFRQSLQQPLFKDPEHYDVSAMRLAYDNRAIMNVKPLIYWAAQQGESIYGRVTPDGYPLSKTFWNGPGQIEKRFEIARSIGFGNGELFKPDGVSAPLEAPMSIIKNTAYDTQVVVNFAPQTRSVLSQAKSNGEWNSFLLASPDFMER